MNRFLLFAVAATLFAACNKEELKDPNELDPIVDETPETIVVGFEDDETRIQLNETQNTVWTNGDLVSVFYRSNGNQQWKYDGETGARQATLRQVQNATGNTSITKTIVVYPYNETYWLNTDSYCIEATTPATQHYTANSYGVGDNLMVSQGEFTQFSLKNVYGWLKLQIIGDGEIIKNIKFRGNNGEQVAGLIYIDTETAESTLATEMGSADDNNAGGSLVSDDAILTEITLDCGEGVKLLPVVTSFYISIPPQTFEKGFTVEIEDAEGYVMKQSTEKPLLIERNHIQPMAAFKFINPNTEEGPKPANNEIWYTATEKVVPYWDDANTYGVRLVTNTWDEATGKGIYTFAGDVTKVGENAFLECKKLKSIVLPDSATEIGSSAFKDCDGLKEVTIGDGVKTIGSSAFYDCDAITTVSFGDSLQVIGGSAFRSCNALQEVTFGGNITIIGEFAFYECTRLTSVVIGDSVTSVGESAFNGCSALNNVIIGNGLTEIASFIFKDCSALKTIVIPDGVKNIESSAFKNCNKLENITIGSNVEDIDPNAFYSCKAIKTFYGKYATTDGRALIKDDKVILYAKASGSEYTIPNGVTSIGNRAFEYATLASITIPESITSIEEYAFNYCSNLKKVYINAIFPPMLGYNAFSSNASGRRFYVYDEAVKYYKKQWSGYSSDIYGNGSYDEETTTIYYTTTDGNIINSDYLSIKENTYTDDQGKMVVCGKLDILPDHVFSSKNTLASITIPEGVTSIGESAFDYCRSLTSVTIPNSVTSIGERAFYCNGLTSVTIPNSVTSIGDYAFYNCGDLTSVTISNSVTHIGERAFAYCGKMSNITLGNSVEVIEDSAFEGCNNITSITIPDSVTYIGTQAFNISSLKEFKGKFASADGRCLIQDETLIAYANGSGTEYIIPESATKIGAYAFYNNSLKSITLHENITEIGTYAFYSSYYDYYSAADCRIYIMSYYAPYLGDNGFNRTSYLKIFVPNGSENQYKSDYSWEYYSMLIYPYDYNRVQANNEIWYISVGDVILEPHYRNAFGNANILSNYYQNGFGVITFDSDITEIGSQAFYNCDGLTSVTIPDSVTSIGDNAFSDCYGLTSVTIPNSVTSIGERAFNYCYGLTSVTIPNSVTSIGDYAFYFCDGLTSVTIPDSVVELGNGVFSYCSALSEFKGKFAEDNGRILVVGGKLVSASAGLTECTIPSNVTSIGDDAFYACRSLTSVTIPNSVTSIGERAFNYCSSLTSVTIPNSVTSIGERAFNYCSSLTSVTIPNSVTSIGNYAFEDCYGLTSVTIPDSVVELGNCIFRSCRALSEFKGKFAEDNGRILVVDGELVSIASAGLTEYTIPSNVTSIGNYAFYNCDGLTSVTIPNSVTSIVDRAFYDCDGLTSVTIPNSVTSIGNYAFSSCDGLKSIYCNAIIPPTLNKNSYSDYHHFKDSPASIYVPKESVGAYKSATGWSEYADAIVGYDFENGVVVE